MKVLSYSLLASGRHKLEAPHRTMEGAIVQRKKRTEHWDERQQAGAQVMKRKGVEGLPADPQESLAANDEFADSGDGYAHLTHSRSGWDPYDVWRTRVKNGSRVQEQDTDSRR